MPNYSVEGKLGAGKTKFSVWMAQQALQDGRRVASNIDIDLSKLLPNQRCNYVRLPDKPTAFDLDAAGHGNPDSYDEDDAGLMILDELGTWLNARAFQDKSRSSLIDWFIHARKRGWDVFFLVQGARMIDAQVRENLIEYEVKMFRGDKIKIPFIGGLLNDLGCSLLGRRAGRRWGYLPKFHMAVARAGEGANKVLADRWVFRGADLHAAYDTRQEFLHDYPHGSFSRWHVPPSQPPSLFRRVLAAFKPAPPRPSSLYWNPRDYQRPRPTLSTS